MSEDVRVPLSRLRKMLIALMVTIATMIALAATVFLTYVWGYDAGAKMAAAAERALREEQDAATLAALREQRNVTWTLLNGGNCDPTETPCTVANLMKDALGDDPSDEQIQKLINAYQNRFMWFLSERDVAAMAGMLGIGNTDRLERADAMLRIVAANRQADTLIASILSDAERLAAHVRGEQVPLE